MIRVDGIEIDRTRYLIRHRGLERYFQRSHMLSKRPSVMFRTWEALIVGDCTRQYLFELLYGDDENGGPNQGFNILNVRMSMWQKDFARMQLDWIREKRGGTVHWHLAPTKESAE